MPGILFGTGPQQRMVKRKSQSIHPSCWQYLYRQHFSSEAALCIYHSNCPQNLQYTSQPGICTSPSTLSVKNRDKCTIQRQLECWIVRKVENNYLNSKSALELKYMQTHWSKRVKVIHLRHSWCWTHEQEERMMYWRMTPLFLPWWDDFQGPSC